MPAQEDAFLWSLNQRIAQYAFISWNNAIDKSLWYLGFSLGVYVLLHCQNMYGQSVRQM